MANMTGWDIVLFVVAGYVAVMSMARLMIRRRNQFLVKFREETKAEQKRIKAEEEKRVAAEEADKKRKGGVGHGPRDVSLRRVTLQYIAHPANRRFHTALREIPPASKIKKRPPASSDPNRIAL